MKLLVYSVVLAVVAWVLAFSEAYSQRHALPQSLGRMELKKVLEGKEAQVFLDRLHQKAVAPKSSVTGEYQSGDKSATLYVSLYTTEREARAAGSRMMRLIKGGNRAFGHYSEKHHGRLLVGRCVGMGQIHYVFQRSEKVYWLSIDPSHEQEALEGLLKHLSFRNEK